MNLVDVMDDVAGRLRTVDGLNVHPSPPGSVSPPAAIMWLPENITFDATYGRGSDRMTLPLVLAVAKTLDRSSRDAIGAYCDGSGDRSVKALLESGTYTAFHTLTVTGIEFDMLPIGGTEYVSALFDLDIFGAGSP